MRPHTRPVTYGYGRLVLAAAISIALAVAGSARARVEGVAAYGVTPEGREALASRGFVVAPVDAAGVREVYEQVAAEGAPPFITTDSVLLATHTLLDGLLYSIEDVYLYDRLEELSREIVRLSEEQYYLATNPLVKEAARRNIAYFAVGLSLLDPDYFPSETALGLVERELELIEEARTVGFSPIMGPTPLDGVAGPGEDYSAYAPFGHYASNERMGRFYRAVTWYQRMAFALPEGRVEDASLTIQALLVARALESEAGVWLELWERVHEPLVFFCGGAGDPTVSDYIEIAADVFGRESEIDDLGDEGALLDFIDRVSERAPAHFETHQLRGMRFLAQRFYPDVRILDRLGGSAESGAASSVDVMALLGSASARAVAEGRDAFGNEAYRRGYEEIEREFQEMTYGDWTKDLYWSWLHALSAMLGAPPDGAPSFMTTRAWDAKALSTAAASWACLRDGCLLPSAALDVSEEPTAAAGPGLVEPYPELYARLRELMYNLRDHLWDHYLLDEELNDAISTYCEFLTTLERRSISYLKGEDVSRVPPDLLPYHRALASLVRVPGVPSGSAGRATSGFLAIAHADPAASRCLNVGVGGADLILVRAKLGGEESVYSGAVLSFYEFVSSMEGRPTQDEWGALVSERAVERPDWVGRFLVP